MTVPTNDEGSEYPASPLDEENERESEYGGQTAWTQGEQVQQAKAGGPAVDLYDWAGPPTVDIEVGWLKAGHRTNLLSAPDIQNENHGARLQHPERTLVRALQLRPVRVPAKKNKLVVFEGRWDIGRGNLMARGRGWSQIAHLLTEVRQHRQRGFLLLPSRWDKIAGYFKRGAIKQLLAKSSFWAVRSPSKPHSNSSNQSDPVSRALKEDFRCQWKRSTMPLA